MFETRVFVICIIYCHKFIIFILLTKDTAGSFLVPPALLSCMKYSECRYLRWFHIVDVEDFWKVSFLPQIAQTTLDLSATSAGFSLSFSKPKYCQTLLPSLALRNGLKFVPLRKSSCIDAILQKWGDSAKMNRN